MTTVAEQNENKPDLNDDDDSEESGSRATGTKAVASSGGFFTIYKSGQGYATRMGTVAGAVLLTLLLANFLYFELPPRITYLRDHRGFLIGLVAAFVAGMALLTFYLINKPKNAQFLIDTDQEMKKVNWTSRKELIGSTKVVVFFMFLIAGILFVIDVGAGYFFYMINVLKSRPF